MISPLENDHFVGHAAIEQQFVDAWQSGKLPHSLLFCGAKGVGKATFAFRLARFVLSGGNDSGGLFGGTSNLDIPAESPVFRRMVGSAHGDFLYLIPDAKAATPTIKVDAVREISSFLALTPSESQWRVVIIDAADDMNPNAANALLKVLEEPPSYCLMILISHQPGMLLPTIRSRCRVIEFSPLSESDFSQILSHAVDGLSDSDLQSLFALSHGSPGFAAHLYQHSAADLYALLLDAMLPDSPSADQSRATLLKRLTSSKDNALWSVWQHVWNVWLYRIAICSQGAALPYLSESDEASIGQFSGLIAPDGISHLQGFAAKWFADADTLHLDRKQVLNAIFSETQKQLKTLSAA